MPAAELSRYAVDLRALTGGAGRFRTDARRLPGPPVPPRAAPRRRDRLSPVSPGAAPVGLDVAIDLTRLSPGDAVTALRSYPRRYRSALALVDDDESLEELAHAEGPRRRRPRSRPRPARCGPGDPRRRPPADPGGGHPDRAPRAVIDPAERSWEAPVTRDGGRRARPARPQASELAEAAAAFSGDQWNRSADVSGGGTVTAFDVVKETVRVGHDGLDVVERTLASVRP